MNISKPGIFFIFLSLCLSAQANVKLPRIFSDNMVLQRNAPIPVWGWAAPNEKVTVKFNKQFVSLTAGANGKWMARLNPEKAGGPFELRVSGANSLAFKNVLVGEVWLCSGQSNMEWTVGQSMNAEKELASADNPVIRHIKVPRNVDSMPREDIVETGWEISTPENTKDFTGVGYFFARNIYNELKVPIGLIHSSWGGTNIETWISREGFESSDEFRDVIAHVPKIDFATLAKRKVEVKQAQVEALQGRKAGTIDGDMFKSANFDDSNLPMLNLPEVWESQSLGDMDGVVWLRKTFNVSPEDVDKTATIELAKIDDNDITYINGVEIGKTNQWDALRRYAVPKGVLKAGQNVVAMRVTDTGGGGGVYGSADNLRLVLSDSIIPLSGKWKFHVESIKAGAGENEFPSLAYNGMIAPLAPYGIRGVLWYQGESNAGRSYQYRKTFPLLIKDWRQKWGIGNFPFYFVQLATYKTNDNSNTGSGWAELREAQTLTLQVPNTGMAVTTDIGDPNDIHPRNKQDVGRRLAALALNRTYKKRTIDSGPSFKSMRIEGNKVVLSFENIGKGLMTTDKNGIVLGFELAGQDQVFYEASGIIKGNAVILTSDKVASPMAVHFGWLGDASANNLFNKEGFPAVPFRTDDWKTITKEAKYKVTEIK